MTPLRAAFIPAAGLGTRLRPLTDTVPKPLIPVGGTPMLDRALAWVRAAGVARIVVNAHHLADQIVTHLAGSDVAVSVEVPDLLDTGGGLKAALALLGDADPILTLNPDVLYRGPNPAQVLAGAWATAGADIDALVLVVPQDRRAPAGPGDFSVDAQGRVTRPGPMTYTGAQLLRPGVVADWPGRVFGLNAVWNDLIARDRLRAVPYPGHWRDVGTLDGLRAADALLAGDPA